MMNDDDIALQFQATICIRPNSQDPLFGTSLLISADVNWPVAGGPEQVAVVVCGQP